MKESKLKRFVPVIIFFIVLNGFFISAKNMLQRWHTDQEVLIIGNLLLFVITLISFFDFCKRITKPQPECFCKIGDGKHNDKDVCMCHCCIYLHFCF